MFTPEQWRLLQKYIFLLGQYIFKLPGSETWTKPGIVQHSPPVQNYK